MKASSDATSRAHPPRAWRRRVRERDPSAGGRERCRDNRVRGHFRNCASRITRLSWLCCCVLPGQADDVHFFAGWLVGARGPESGGEENAAELGEHAGGGRLGLAVVPRCPVAVVIDVGWVVACGGVPGHGQGLAGELERDGAADRVRGAVAGLAGAEELLRVFYRDLYAPPGCVAPDQLRGAGVQVRGDQGQVVPGLAATDT